MHLPSCYFCIVHSTDQIIICGQQNPVTFIIFILQEKENSSEGTLNLNWHILPNGGINHACSPEFEFYLDHHQALFYVLQQKPVQKECPYLVRD